MYKSHLDTSEMKKCETIDDVTGQYSDLWEEIDIEYIIQVK